MDDSVGLSLNLVTYGERSHRYAGYDTVLNLKVASIEYVFLNKYVHTPYKSYSETHKHINHHGQINTEITYQLRIFTFFVFHFNFFDFLIFFVTIFRSIEEFTNYFSAFSEMREVVALQADAVVNVTKESVKRKSEEKMKLEIVVDAPVIVVPASTNSAHDFFSFKLGMSKKGNCVVIFFSCGSCSG